MKKIFVAISLISTLGFAKTSGQTCFSSTKSADTEVPSLLCMNDIGLYNNGDTEWITVYGGNMAGNYEIGQSLFGKPQAALEIENYESGPCGNSHTTKIILKLNTDFSLKLNSDTIQVSVERESYLDSCHSHPETEEILFQKIK